MSALLERLWYPEGKKVPPWLWPLALPEALFRGAVAVRNAGYDRGLLRSTRVPAKVISVGNLTVGGAGKTPVVIELARRLLARGAKVAILSRGYGRIERGAHRFSGGGARPSVLRVGDEPLMIARAVPEAEVHVGARRVALAQAAVAAGATHLLLDDGMQHRQLARDVEVAVVDGAVGLGTGRLMPLGPLREPPSALRRASLIWLREGPRIPPLPEGVPVVRVRHLAVALRDPEGKEVPLDSARPQGPLLAFCGIARPGAFFATLDGLGLPHQARSFPDHHLYSPQELAELSAHPGALITTEKDRARLPEGFAAWSVVLGVQVLDGEEALLRALV